MKQLNARSKLTCIDNDRDNIAIGNNTGDVQVFGSRNERCVGRRALPGARLRRSARPPPAAEARNSSPHNSFKHAIPTTFSCCLSI